MSHFIPLTEARQMTALYRNNREAILQPSYQNQALLPLSETFDRAAFDTVLAKSGCTALRIYYGMDESLKVHALIVGVDANGQDLIPADVSAATATDEDIIEHGVRCQEICPTSSLLTT